MKEPLERLGAAIARSQEPALQKSSSAERARFLAAVARAKRHGSRGSRARLILSSGGVLAAAAVLVLGLLRRTPELGYRITGGEQSFAGERWLSAAGERVRCEFSDGSRIELERDADVRLVSLSAESPVLALERGSLHVNIIPSADRTWIVRAGPFSIRVLGTEFQVAWSADRAMLELEMERGEVQLGGPLVEGQRVAGHDRVRVWVRDGRFERVSPAAPSDRAPPAEELPEATMVVPEAEPSAEVARSRPGSARRERARPEPPAEGTTPSWEALAAEGRYEDAMELVMNRGLEDTMSDLDARRLLELGDTARLADRPELAIRVYESVRRRFPGTAQAARAAFLLGRIARDPARAAQWFDLAAREDPEGQLAREAAGRRIEALHAAGQDSAAREAARRYLGRYPTGPHAGVATQLLTPEQ